MNFVLFYLFIYMCRLKRKLKLLVSFNYKGVKIALTKSEVDRVKALKEVY